jgi:murein DD-endopeptidase MepM/ murein hydrolase activator NlpD
MRGRKAEKSELLVRVASTKNLALTAAVLVGALVFIGSPVSFSAPANEAVGGVGATLDPLSADGLAPSNPTEDRGLYYSVCAVGKGDTVGAIAEKYGVSVDTIISFNNIQNTRALRPGQLLKVPSMTGIICTAKAGDTVDSLAASYEVGPNGIIEANGLLSTDIAAGKVVFIPDAKLPSMRLREINGDLFMWPIRGWITSRYGWRSDPFTGVRSYHDGIDIGADRGTPIGAAMEGRVVEKGYSSSFGNYVLLSHHDGYMSFYGHMNSPAIVGEGQWVTMGQKIGYVGNTGYSTGPHLHFTVFKGGRTMNPTIVLH